MRSLKIFSPVSRILFHPKVAAIIYLVAPLLAKSICLPSGVDPFQNHRTSRPQPPVYMAFQHTRFTPAWHYYPAL
jgi:hypothetical protein